MRRSFDLLKSYREALDEAEIAQHDQSGLKVREGHLDDGSRVENEHAKKPINHKRRTGGQYEPKGPVSDEERHIRSEGMKAFHRKTGKGTALGNAQVRRTRKPKS